MMSKLKRVWMYLLGYRGWKPVEVEEAYLRFRFNRATKNDKKLLEEYYGK